MLNHFQKIKNIGCYEEYLFDADALKPFNSVNIIYGNNGSGKTTFSNILFLLSKHCKDKSQLLAELIDSDSELEIIFDTEKITQRNILEKKFDLYVFNSKFITDHVYNGTMANIDSFSSDIKLTSPEIEKIDELLNHRKVRLQKLQKWISLIETKLGAIFKTYNDEFQKNISGARLTGIKPSIGKNEAGDLLTLKKELSTLYKDYSKKSKESNTIDRYNILKSKLTSIINIDIDIQELSKRLELKISSEAKGKVAKRIEAFETQIEEKKLQGSIGDLNDWLKKGGRLLHVSKNVNIHCPLCDTDLSSNIDSIISEYSNYFSDSIVTLFDFVDKINSVLDLLIIENQINKNEEIINELIITCEQVYGFQMPSFGFEATNNQQLMAALQQTSQLLKQKKQNPESQLYISTENIDLIKSYIIAIINFKEEALKRIDAEIFSVQRISIDALIKKIKAKIAVISSVELNEKSNNIFKSIRKTNSDIANIASHRIIEIEAFNEKQELLRSTEVSKLNAESKYINLYLNNFGISNFNIDRVKDKSQDNLIITYSKSGKKKTKLNHSLSEGEKTALAFAYFISKLRVEKIEGSENGFEDCIVVVDDPISSLDDNRLFQTANLIDSFLFYNKKIDEGETEEFSHYPNQVFILSHNLTFIKYLHNAIKGNINLKDKTNEYFLSSHAPIIKKLPSGLKNFTNTYIVKLKEIMEYKDKKIEYDVVKNYLPNYIRIVLETFLSFKLAIVNDTTGRLPGLSHLINGMIKEFEYVDDIEIDGVNKDGVIKRLNHLKKIADHESHGSIFKAEEFAFISDEELNVFAKNTLQVLNYIDNLHFKKIKSHTA